ncbi:MAG: hypothetical protein WD623_02675 [Marinobacter sp.]|uniref:hypothetical protein n=1 Tax=Marinobacter sp. TaxID=50741 RepID=UPI0034A0ABF4
MDFKCRSVKISDIRLDSSVYSVNRCVANIIEPCFDKLELTPFAIELLLASSPLIGWESKSKTVHVFGNLRSLYLVSQLDNTQKVPVLLVPEKSISDPTIFSIQSTLLSLLNHSVDRRVLTDLISLFWQELDTSDNRGQLSPRFVSKSGLAEAAGINRRDFPRQTQYYHSKFMAYREADE